MGCVGAFVVTILCRCLNWGRSSLRHPLHEPNVLTEQRMAWACSVQPATWGGRRRWRSCSQRGNRTLPQKFSAGEQRMARRWRRVMRLRPYDMQQALMSERVPSIHHAAYQRAVFEGNQKERRVPMDGNCFWRAASLLLGCHWKHAKRVALNYLLRDTTGQQLRSDYEQLQHNNQWGHGVTTVVLKRLRRAME